MLGSSRENSKYSESSTQHLLVLPVHGDLFSIVWSQWIVWAISIECATLPTAWRTNEDVRIWQDHRWSLRKRSFRTIENKWTSGVRSLRSLLFNRRALQMPICMNTVEHPIGCHPNGIPSNCHSNDESSFKSQKLGISANNWFAIEISRSGDQFVQLLY